MLADRERQDVEEKQFIKVWNEKNPGVKPNGWDINPEYGSGGGR